MTRLIYGGGAAADDDAGEVRGAGAVAEIQAAFFSVFFQGIWT